MTEAQKRFCDEYLIDLNATRAYKVAYPNCKKDETASVNGSKLLRNTKVKGYIVIHQKQREERTQVTQDKVIQELAKIAFADIRTLYDDNGSLKNVKCLEDNIAGAVSQLETFEEYDGKGKDRDDHRRPAQFVKIMNIYIPFGEDFGRNIINLQPQQIFNLS